MALEVADDQWEVGVQHEVALGPQQLQREDVTLVLQEFPYHVLGGRWERGPSAWPL